MSSKEDIYGIRILLNDKLLIEFNFHKNFDLLNSLDFLEEIGSHLYTKHEYTFQVCLVPPYYSEPNKWKTISKKEFLDMLEQDESKYTICMF